MNRKQPTIAFTVGMFNAIDGPMYCVYTHGYGMEMSVDSEWPLNILMMAPPHLVSCLTRAADVCSMGIIAGASYTPGDGNYKQIKSAKGKWVLARPADDIQAIVSANLGAVLLIEKVGELKKIFETSNLTEKNLIVAVQINSISTLETTKKIVEAVRKKLPKECTEATILISGSFEHSNLLEYSNIGSASGLLLLDASFDSILELIPRMLG